MPAPSPTGLIDRVDDTDQPVGVIPRRDVFRARAGFRTVHIFVQNEVGDILLQQVGARRERSPLRWGSSVAGYLHAGETYLQAAQRRLAEELGLPSRLHKLGAIRMADNGATKFIELFTTEAGTVPFVLAGHIEAVQFFTIHEIDNDLQDQPERFTETFPFVYRLFRIVTSP